MSDIEIKAKKTLVNLALGGGLANKSADLVAFVNKTNFPTRSDEKWKNQPSWNFLEAISKSSKKKDTEIKVEEYLPSTTKTRIVFVNGHYAEGLSVLESDVIDILPFGEAKKDEDFNKAYNKSEIAKKNLFTALNTITAKNGTFLKTKKNTKVEEPITLVHFWTDKNSLAQLRNLFLVSPGSAVDIVELHYGIDDSESFSNICTEVFVAANAKAEHVVVQKLGASSSQINQIEVIQEADSNYKSFFFNMQGGYLKNLVTENLLGQNANSTINGLSLPKEQEYFDTHTYLNHAAPHCDSSQLFKSIVNDNASAVYFGLVYVAPDAQQTNAYQQNSNIALTDSAKIFSKPQLEIYADDVKCSHGSTTGQLDQEAMFYMRARGIDKASALKLLLDAFAKEVVMEIGNSDIQEYVNCFVEERL